MVLPIKITDMTGTGEHYVLTGNNAVGLFDQNAHGSAVFVGGTNDSVLFDWRGGDSGSINRIADHGKGTVIAIGYGSRPEFQPIPYQQEQLWNFQNDPTGRISVVSPTVNLGPDGHGGTNVYGLDWQLDVIGDPHLTMAQIVP